jgi:16S rRNA (guanine966-N2)-methyltransferase
MRIIAGTAGGRKLLTPDGDAIRPTSDKVRGAIFNSLLSKISVQGANVLDCFCGSGALGLEALSRGAAHCTFVDNSRTSLDLAKENAKALKFENASFIFSDAAKLKAPGKKASLVFLDPPYNKNLIIPALEALHVNGWLEKDAVAVVETEKTFSETYAAFVVLDEKNYGDTKVSFLKYTPSPSSG